MIIKMQKQQKIAWMGLALSAVVMTASANTVPANQQKLVIDKKDVKVWTYQSQKLPVFSYRAETTYAVPARQAVAVVLDAVNSMEWVPYLGKVEVLSRNDQKGEFLLYMVLDFPFPLKDRDVVVKGKMHRETDGTMVIKNQVANNVRAKHPDYIRLTHYEGDWTFQPLGPNKVKVTTSGYADPAGSIPLSFVNMFVQQQPYQMLLRMRNEVVKPKYQQVPLPEALAD